MRARWHGGGPACTHTHTHTPHHTPIPTPIPTSPHTLSHSHLTPACQQQTRERQAVSLRGAQTGPWSLLTGLIRRPVRLTRARPSGERMLTGTGLPGYTATIMHASERATVPAIAQAKESNARTTDPIHVGTADRLARVAMERQPGCLGLVSLAPSPPFQFPPSFASPLGLVLAPSHARPGAPGYCAPKLAGAYFFFPRPRQTVCVRVSPSEASASLPMAMTRLNPRATERGRRYLTRRRTQTKLS